MLLLKVTEHLCLSLLLKLLLFGGLFSWWDLCFISFPVCWYVV